MKLKFALILFFSISTASAYVPPSGFLVNQLVKKHKSLKSIRVKTRITGASAQIREIGYFDVTTKTWKARFIDSNDREIYAFERKLGSTDSLASLLLFETSSSNLISALKNSGIPVLSEQELLALPGEPERRAAEKTSIGRLDRKIGWVIGDLSTALWILKDEFVPLKLLTAGSELRFEETKNTRDFPYARAISLYHGSEFVLKGEAMEVIPNPDLADMRAIQTSGLPLIPSSIPNEERNLIEQWVQWVR